MKKIFSILIALGCLVPLSLRATVINGVLVDSQDTTELIEATVKLLMANKDSTMVKGTTTDMNGVFNIKGVKAGRYLLRFSYLGYNDVIKHVTVGDDGRDVNIGVVTMDPNSIMLKETVVMGVKSPIVVKEDTIEFNADTYKTQANAVVEDLLKRLPGVEVGSDGKITANGKEVKKILIDGKEFFSDDPTVASKNIPADMVNKLQVIDRKSDLARLTGVDDGEDETVINLTVKKGMNNGWFGTVNAGYGTDERYAGNVMINHFRDGNQFTILGGGNNTNNLGFGDGASGRFQRFGGDRGITTSQYAGINFNVGGKEDDHFRVGGDLMYSHSDRDTRTRTARQYLFEDSTSYENSSTAARDKSHNLRGDFRIKWEVDSNNTIDFRPNFSFNFNKSERGDTSSLFAGDPARTAVNRSASNFFNDGKSFEWGTRLIYNHKVASHPGRSQSLMLNYSYSNVREDADTYTDNTYYLLPDQNELIDQTANNRRKTHNVTGRISWTEPIGDVKNARFLEFSYRGNYRYTTSDKMVYDNERMGTWPSGTITDSVWNEGLSNRFRNTFYNQQFSAGFRQVRKAYNLNVGISVNSAMSKSKDLINSARDIRERWAWSVAPYARFRYKFTETRNLNFNYFMRAQQPSITQLQPVADESNPLNIVIGNPELKPTFNHSMNLRFSDFAQGAQRSIMAMMNVDFAQNSIISTTTFDNLTGGRTTSYMNVNGVWNAMAMNMVSFPFGSSKVWYFSNHVFARYSVAKGMNDGVLNRSNTLNLNLSPGLAFRNDVFDLEIRPRYGFQNTTNTVKASNIRTVHTWGGFFNGTYSAPFGLVISTDLNYSTTSGYSAGYNTNQWRWNGSIAYQFLSEKQASLTLSVYDILGQQKNIFRNVTGDYIEDVYYNSLGRYGMLTFTYRFNTFKKGEQPKDRNEDFRGPGRWGGGSGGGRPSGPPPGGRPPF
ncbi:MAG: TonB-dependent receptor [Muribaculaceae bacterium]|nr:TonB-dependent receptor [Muribaculaceae bacterium]